MNSRCLFCDKRLSFFHGEEEAVLLRRPRGPVSGASGQNRVGPSAGRVHARAAETSGSVLAARKPLPRPLRLQNPTSPYIDRRKLPEFSDPPAAEYLAGDPTRIPAQPFLSGIQALQLFRRKSGRLPRYSNPRRALLSLGAAQIGPGLVTFLQVLEEPQLEIQPGLRHR